MSRVQVRRSTVVRGPLVRHTTVFFPLVPRPGFVGTTAPASIIRDVSYADLEPSEARSATRRGIERAAAELGSL